MFGIFSVEKGKTESVVFETLEKELLDTNKCYILDCGLELFVWKGRNTSVDQRKSASEAAEVHFLPQVNKSCFFYGFCSMSYCYSSFFSGVFPFV